MVPTAATPPAPSSTPRHATPRHATPAHTWFLAIYLLTQRKIGLSALQLPRELSFSYNSAWQLKHRLLQVMQERN